MILLRKLRKSRQGIDLEKFNRGEAGKFVEREDASVKYGMQSVKGKGRAEEREPLYVIHPRFQRRLISRSGASVD